jgi:hypothetical protein
MALLMQPADIYLIDEPSAYLDSEQRIVASKVIKRFILHAKKTAFVVEHDFIMATYLADRVIVYEGKPSIDCIANCPQSLLTGMNLFLSVSVTTVFLVCPLLSPPSPSFSLFFFFQLQSIKNLHGFSLSLLHFSLSFLAAECMCGVWGERERDLEESFGFFNAW